MARSRSAASVRLFALLLASTSTLSGIAAAQTLRTITLSKQYHQQTSLKARIEFAAGTLQLHAGSPTALYGMQLSYDPQRFTPLSRFDEATGELTLGVDRTGEGGLRVSSREHLAQTAEITLSPLATLSLDMNLGAAEADIDLGGLRLSDALVQSGASQTVVRFSTPNPIACEVAEFGAGAASFSALSLGNSRCRHVRFDGGVGETLVDLTGAWTEDAEVELHVALGQLTLKLPRSAGVELTLDRFLSSFEPSGFVRTGRIYRSVGFDQAVRKLRVSLTSTVGGVTVEWE